MDWSKYQGVALLLLRLVIAGIFLWHGFGKTDPTVAAEKFVNMNFPGFLGVIVGWAEVILGLALLAGFMTRWVSLGLLVIIVVALIGVQIPGNINAGKILSGLERDSMVFAGLLVMLSAGPGILSVDKGKS